ncbi:glycosyltransferase family 2 protein [Desulfopila sp. IMCC35006]|uniref:glycosyltransferase family 2 protein n=1 Tax=Desulfopila sp. IMCC35006 TaxID=2569542 RepID=UPI0010ABBB7F|nr:glycosyltransferase family 2 protein [Desulfopila sp. IMCC35006]TKB26120.1 glycosyltransferase family 2 protein [Desulfopila sp. IMCC35006]
MQYSVVIPVYNSAAIVGETVDRVREFFLVQGHHYEIILVNDGSRDDSWSVITRLARAFPEVIAINLLKNYGQHNANLCGFREAKGDYVITMDDDLQNPPEEVSKLIESVRQGHDLVIGHFESKKHSLMRRIGSHMVGWLIRTAFDVKDDLVLSNFRIIRRDVVDRVCRNTSVAPYIPGLVLKYSAHRCNVLVRHLPRAEGKSNYTIRKLLGLVANIMFNHSTIPLRYGAAFGFIVSGISFLLGLFYLLRTLIDGVGIPGWATLVVLMSFFNGVLILLLSVIGEYLIRVLREIGTFRSYEISEVVRQ